MITFKYERDAVGDCMVIPDSSSIDVGVFEELIGRKINWNARYNKTILFERVGSRIVLRDPIFIIGCTYKKLMGRPMICTYVNNNNEALLTPKSGIKLAAITASNSLEWEIVN